MTYRPYPNSRRALRQVERHDGEWAPGGAFPPLMNLPPGWEQPILPETVKLTPAQVAALQELPERMRRNAEALRAAAVTALSETSRRLTAMRSA